MYALFKNIKLHAQTGICSEGFLIHGEREEKADHQYYFCVGVGLRCILLFKIELR
jgi:hypothetical protein